MLPKRLTVCCGAVVLAGWLLAAQTAQAQLSGTQSRGNSRTTGTSGTGGGRTTGTGMGTGMSAGQTGGAGQGGTSAGFIFQNNSQATTRTGGMGGMTGMRGGMGGFGGFGGFGNMSRFATSAFGAASSSSKPAVRTRLANAVELPVTATSVAAAEARTTRLASVSPARRIVNGYDVVVSDGVATVTGVASDDRSRRMAELMLKLEPGVNRVDNQIVVSP